MTAPGKTPAPLLFVDGEGGALAALAAGLAQGNGKNDAQAATIGELSAVPADITTVLAEIGMTAANVAAFDIAKAEGHDVVWLGETAPPKPLERARAITCNLLPPDAEELGRLATARIARDRIERFLES